MATPPTKGTVTYDSTYNGVLPDPKRSGYDFGGWFTAPNGKGSKIENNTKVTTTSAQTLYAKWTAKTYNVTLNFQDKVTSSSIIKVTYGSLYGKLPSPLYTGYTFGGWFTGKDGTGVKITSGMKVSITSPMALYACWTANTYTVTIDFQDGTTHSQSIMVKYASAYGSLPAPNRAGYLFFGWFTEKNGAGTKITAATKETIARNHTLYANWTVDPIPSSVSAVSSGYNSILVKWAAVPNARGYEVYSATAMAGIYTNVGMVTGTSLKNTGLNTGKIYYYKVRSFTLSGSTKIYSDYSVIVPAWPKPAVPTNPKALRKNSTSIKLSWGKVAGATKYEIWRCVAGGNFTLISTVTSNSYINTKLSTGTTYCYEVRAYRQVKKVKVYGEFSSEASAKP